MDETRWERVKRIVDEALDETDPGARRRFLDTACGDDAEIRREVEALLVFEHEPLLRDSMASRAAASDAGSTLQKAALPAGGPPERFPPGAVLSGRYRIIERVGRGGMGEVYHARDLALEQEVALKFLPLETASSAHAQKRFRSEVRTARQIAHPNVCRVYDLGDLDGQAFISMEYIRGEDLESLLRRIGRLPVDKGAEIAVQLASGLAAAHEQGVLHRDLKPANVMLDEHGQVRITDFGLAAVAGDVDSKDVRSGTPAYMAPEQARGEAVDERSDIYSLGLVLYEIFTGRPAFPEPPDPRKASRPLPPSSLVDGLDPAVARVILRCLEHDPADRPSSAATVRDRLPGGDLLAEAIARGDTPARALVAEAGESAGLETSVAWVCLAIVLVGLGAVLWLAPRSRLSGLVPLPESPEILSADARRILEELGYPTPQRDSAFGFVRSRAYVDSLLDGGDLSVDWWSRLSRADPGTIRFWYRESPRHLVPRRLSEFFASELDPPPVVPGMVGLRLDTFGRLRELRAVPPLSPGPGGGTPDWETLFGAAGFELADFRPVEPRWRPASYADVHAAWEGAYPDAPEIPIRVEAAALDGRIVELVIVEPWGDALREAEEIGLRRSDVVPTEAARLLHVGLDVLLVLALPWLAWRSFRSGRGDRELALRLAVVLSALVLAQWLLASHHVAERSQLQVLYGGLFRASFVFVLAALLYLVLEPYARKLWPRALVSWVRLLGGRYRDPVVGRDVLAGCVFGVLAMVVNVVSRLSPGWLGRVPLRPDFPQHPAELLALRGTKEAVAQLLAIQVNIVTHVMFLFVALLLLRLLFRKTWIAVALHWLLYVLVFGSGYGYVAIVVFITGWHALFFRFGWLAILVGTVVVDLLVGFPLTADLSAWHVDATVIALGFCLALAVYGFKVALAGRPAFTDVLDDA